MKYDEKQAKIDMLKMLKEDMMSDDDLGLGQKLGKMKKVTVMSDSEEGLEKGMSKAQQILKQKLAKDDSACPDCGKQECECDDSSKMSKMEMLKKMFEESEDESEEEED